MSERRRSQRIMLRMPIVVIATGPDKSPAREESHTLVVNAHGGLIQLALQVKVGQVLILKNPESEEQSCRVVRIDRLPGGKTEVAVEFLKPAPHFWHVSFPPEDWVPRAPELTSDTF